MNEKERQGFWEKRRYETFDTNDHDAYRSYGDIMIPASFILGTVSNYSEGAIKTYGNIQK